MTGPGADLGEVRSLHRFPVKSLLGESLEEAAVGRRGLRGDRLFAVRDADGKLGSGKSSRRFRRMDGLLRCSARWDGAVALVRLPGGRELPAPDPACAEALSGLVGRPVTVAAATDDEVPYFDSAPVHLVTTAALRWAGSLAPGSVPDQRRFRPNLVVEAAGTAGVEDGWVGRTIAVGEVRLRVLMRTKRCVMVTLPQCELPHDPRVLSGLTSDGAAYLGVLAEVERPGTVRRGDPVRIV